MNSPFKRPDIDLTGMASMTAAVVAREFLLISRFIPPPQFVLELWSAMADSLGVKVHQTTAYHPQTNGMCKQLHESLKAALWGSLTGLRCAVREDLWDSPAELVLGQPLRQRPEKHDRNTTMQPIQYNSAVVYKGHQSEGSSLSACFRAEAAAVV